MKIKDLQEKQVSFLKNLFDIDPIDTEANLEEFLSSRGCKLYECLGCGKLIFHDNYEFWNLSDCCDDNSKLTEDGLLCEVCYSRTPENFKNWVFFKPTYYKDVDFKI